MNSKNVFLRGFRDGIPIGLGYFVVAFSLGIIAKNSGVAFYQGFLASFLNHASAGEYALFTAIGASVSYIEVALVTFIANARYLLLSSALSQKFDPKTGLTHRLLSGFVITDEIFGISIAQPGFINPWYMYGAFLCAAPLWSLGTACGILAGNILPLRIVSALSVALYGMFLAIIVPPAKKNIVIALCVVISFASSWALGIIPGLKNISSGNKVIILTVIIATAAAIIRPVDEDEKNKESAK
ncbi:AzlC family ABC transporter permease [Treponema sp.]|uniref:AzlC family ABC transporter permease n=1 Tax=Treponema sp. TaxID=166 RepID=UPI00388D905B